MPHPFSSDTLAKNLYRTIEDISVQLAHAGSVKGRARAGYYRNAILLAASCVEAALYDYIDQACTKDPKLRDGVKTFKQSKSAKTLIALDKTTIGTTKELWVCEIDRTKIDKTKSFKDMNDYALELGIVNKQLYESLEFVRKKRNEIHLQTLTTTERQYNNQILERISGVLLKLISKIEKL